LYDEISVPIFTKFCQQLGRNRQNQDACESTKHLAYLSDWPSVLRAFFYIINRFKWIITFRENFQEISILTKFVTSDYLHNGNELPKKKFVVFTNF